MACITTLDVLARSVGANRIIRGKAIVNVVGDPTLRPGDERQYRQELIRQALRALETPVEGPTILA